jgi:hypothetical protein
MKNTDNKQNTMEQKDETHVSIDGVVPWPTKCDVTKLLK